MHATLGWLEDLDARAALDAAGGRCRVFDRRPVPIRRDTATESLCGPDVSDLARSHCLTSHPSRLVTGGEKQPVIASSRAHWLRGLSLYRTRPAVRRRDFMSGVQRPPALPWSRPDAAGPGVSRWNPRGRALGATQKQLRLIVALDSRLSLRESSVLAALLSRSERRLSAACRGYSRVIP